MQYTTEDITPEKAQQYLNTSLGNRAIIKPALLSYINTIKSGKWLLNGSPIIFDNGGHLIDGHHRLMAVVKSGITVRFSVTRGAEDGSFATLDNNVTRTLAQLLRMQDVKNYNLVASIVMSNDQLVRRGRLTANTSDGGNSKTAKFMNADKIALFNLDPKGYEDVGGIICSFQTRCRILPGSWAGGLYYYLTHTGGYSDEEVYPFFDAVFSVDTSSIPVADMLRRFITKERINGRRLSSELLWAFVVKAWNHYVSGTTPKILRYDSQRESMPVLKIKNATE